MSNRCILCGELNQNILLKYCRDCYYEVKQPSKVAKIKPISQKKKERLKREGSETEFFLSIWNERKHECEECGKELRNPRPHNFDHIKPKGMNQQDRYNPANIRILCFDYHFFKDNLTAIQRNRL